MKLKGIKRGNTIEIIDQTIDIPDGTEITLIIEDQIGVTPEEYLASLKLQLQVSAAETSLTSLIGSAPGSFVTPEAADQFIRQERDAWDS